MYYDSISILLQSPIVDAQEVGTRPTDFSRVNCGLMLLLLKVSEDFYLGQKYNLKPKMKKEGQCSKKKHII